MSTPTVTGFGLARDGLPTVGTTAYRDVRFPTPPEGFKVYNIETGQIEIYRNGWLAGPSADPGIGVYVANDYGASPAADGATNRTAILAAYAAAVAAGGGRVTLLPGTYQITGHTTQSLPVPVSGTNYATTNVALDAHFYLLEPTGIYFDLTGVTLTSTKTDGGLMFLFNGPRHCGIIGSGALAGQTAVGGGLVTTVGVSAVGVTTTTRDGFDFVYRAEVSHLFSAFYCFGDTTSAFRMRLIDVDVVHDTGEYSVALHNNGDLARFRTRTTTVGRQYFLYGVDSVDGDVLATSTLGGFQSLTKAYDRDLTNIRLRIRVVMPNSQAKIELDSEHHVASQPTPAVLRNVSIWIDDTGSTGGASVLFRYLVDGVSTGAVATGIFDNVTLQGRIVGTVISEVLQGTAVALDADGLILASGAPSKVLHAQGGWFARQSYQPTIEVGNGTTARLFFGQSATVGPSLSGANSGQAIFGANVYRFFDITTSTEYGQIDSAGRIQWFRGLILPYRSLAVDTTLTDADRFVDVDATGAARIITLPPAAGRAGMLLDIKKIDVSANTVTVDANGAELIDGATTFVISTQFANVSLRGNGTGWGVL